MTQEILCVLHQNVSTTGQVGLALNQLGIRIRVIRPLLGQNAPRDLFKFDGLIIFGGPMSANDDHLAGIRSELALIEQWLIMDRPIWGICLGAQLMARVLGAEVKEHPYKQVEIGWYPINTIGFGQRIFGSMSHVYQWHREEYQLPHGAIRLACGDQFADFSEQAYLFGHNGFATQFHPEMNPKTMRRWLIRAGHMLELPGARSLEQHQNGMHQYFQKQAQWLKRTLKIWLAGRLRTRSKNFCFRSIIST